jgi:hyperosmotically inducible protein
MKLRYAAVFCLTGLAACSNQSNQPEVQDPADVSAAADPSAPMSPASLEQRNTARSDVPLAGDEPRAAANTARANDTAGASTNGSRADDAASGSSEKTSPDAAPAPDNTKVNQRDANSAALTPMDQNNNSADLKITQQIRQAVMGDGSLSFTAKNVKIITQGGKVTLRGPVKTEQERSNIEAAARKVAGVTQVDNQIEVKK